MHRYLLIALVLGLVLSGCKTEEAAPADPVPEPQPQEASPWLGMPCEADAAKDMCAEVDPSLSCAAVLVAPYEYWACTDTDNTAVPILATSDADFVLNGPQVETALKLGILGTDIVFSTEGFSVVRAPRGELEVREGALFYTPPAEPDLVEWPAEEGSEAETFRYDMFSFRVGESQEVQGAVALRLDEDERRDHTDDSDDHTWEVTVDTGYVSLAGLAFVGGSGSVHADRRWPVDCDDFSETVVGMTGGGVTTAVGVGFRLSMDLETQQSRRFLLGHHAAMEAGWLDGITWDIEYLSLSVVLASFGTCRAHVSPYSGAPFSGRDWCSIWGIGVDGGGLQNPLVSGSAIFFEVGHSIGLNNYFHSGTPACHTGDLLACENDCQCYYTDVPPGTGQVLNPNKYCVFGYCESCDNCNSCPDGGDGSGCWDDCDCTLDGTPNTEPDPDQFCDIDSSGNYGMCSPCPGCSSCSQ